MASNRDNTDVLHSCEICGQDRLKENELLDHMKKIHVEGAVECPFCDLSSSELTPDEMTLHVNSAHLEYLTPDQEVVKGFTESDDDFESIWELEREAKKGLTNGIGDSPVEEEPKITSHKEPNSKRLRSEERVDSASTSKAKISPTAQDQSKEVSSSTIGGAIQKRSKNSPTTSRAALKLDVKSPLRTVDMRTKLKEVFDCPMCNFNDEDPLKVQEHVNRLHFDETSPSTTNDTNFHSSSQSSLPTCPICQLDNFKSVLDLERHVNLDHGDILSPGDDSTKNVKPLTTSNLEPSTQDLNDNQSCPVCNVSGFDNQNQLALHIDTHFTSTNLKSTDDSVENTTHGKKKTFRSFKELKNRNSFSFPFSSLSSSSSSSRSSVFSKGSSDTSSNDHLHNDFMLAQEIARREHEKRKFEEQKEFEQLRAQFGMDNEGNYRQQSLTNMQRAVYNGKMSVVDYYERQSDLKQSEQNGIDDGHSVTKNLIPRLKSLCQQTGGVSQVYLCSTVDHHASSFGDKGWGCGYRNLQMLLSSLRHDPEYSNCLKSAFSNDSNAIPSISKLQTLIESAWSAGFDVQGREQLGGRLKNTRKWIGATEIVAFLTSQKIKTELVDFHVPSGKDGTHPRLFQWVLKYFKDHSNARKFTPPLYFQHQGHSRTIIGIEVLSNESHLRLLVFDPSHSRSTMSALSSSNGKNENPATASLRLLRKLPPAIKSKQYQIVAVSGLYSTARESESHKIIRSIRIP